MKKLGDFLRENPKYIRKTIEPKELLEHLLAGGTYIGVSKRHYNHIVLIINLTVCQLHFPC